jgi:acyl-CoA reductase-like NAD-dependent aldehyde dehydrogenase
MQNYKMWIDGQWVEAETGKTIKVINPANGEEFASVPMGGKAEVDKAVKAARKAFPIWSKKPQAERSKIMLEIADALKAKSKEIAELESLDHGFPIGVAENVVQLPWRIFEFCAQIAKSLTTQVIPIPGNFHVYMQREPYGVTALITPWNVPVNSVAKKVAYSIAVGNTCVVKPASVDCLTALKFAEILEKSGLPAGTVNIITGPGSSTGTYLASHPGINMISFTGSSETGKAIMATASGTLKKIQLELGGKNPFIVFEDADLDLAMASAIPGVTFNTGQVCGSPSRFYVHEKIYEKFIDKFVTGMKKVVVGDPADRKTQMGPLVSPEHRDSVESYIKSGIDEGATLLLGGKRPDTAPLNKGYYVMPTIFGDVKQNMKIAREEIFGPVASVLKFSSDDEVIQKANDSPFGLCASIWTKDTAKGIRLTSAIEAGSVWVNSTPSPGAEIPWGGYKESGIGREYAVIGFEDVTQLKVVGINIG